MGGVRGDRKREYVGSGGRVMGEEEEGVCREEG